jgi:hypothetical protein
MVDQAQKDEKIVIVGADVSRDDRSNSALVESGLCTKAREPAVGDKSAKFGGKGMAGVVGRLWRSALNKPGRMKHLSRPLCR